MITVGGTSGFPVQGIIIGLHAFKILGFLIVFWYEYNLYHTERNWAVAKAGFSELSWFVKSSTINHRTSLTADMVITPDLHPSQQQAPTK